MKTVTTNDKQIKLGFNRHGKNEDIKRLRKKINNKVSSVVFKGDEESHVLNKLVSTDYFHFFTSHLFLNTL